MNAADSKAVAENGLGKSVRQSLRLASFKHVRTSIDGHNFTLVEPEERPRPLGNQRDSELAIS